MEVINEFKLDCSDFPMFARAITKVYGEEGRPVELGVTLITEAWTPEGKRYTAVVPPPKISDLSQAELNFLCLIDVSLAWEVDTGDYIDEKTGLCRYCHNTGYHEGSGEEGAVYACHCPAADSLRG